MNMRDEVNNWHVKNYGMSANFDDVFAVLLACGEWAGHDVDVYVDIVNGTIYRELCGATIDELEIAPGEICQLEVKDLLDGDWRFIGRR